MIKVSFKGPSERELTKMVMAAAEKSIADKARKAASAYGGINIKFRRKPDGTLDSVEFEGSESAVRAARHSLST